MTDFPLFTFTLLVMLTATVWLLSPTLSTGDPESGSGINEERLER